MRTNTSRLQDTFPFISAIHVEPSAEKRKICDLLMLQRAAREITSILDLDPLLESVVANAVTDFGGVEASVWLVDPVRSELVLAAINGCSMHKKGHRLRIGQDGLVGHVAQNGRTHYARDVRLEPHYISCEQDILSELNIPLRIRDRLIGVFNIAHPDFDGFTPERIELLEALAGHVAIAIENARVFQVERAEKLLLLSEQEEAARIQRELLPKVSPLIPGLQVEAALVPARVVAGDWYDYIALADGRWAFVIADVSGKGIGAALLMASVRAMLRSIVRHVSSPADILTDLNQILIADLPPERFVTMIIGIYDPQANTIRFANAGHPAPLWIHGDSAVFIGTCSGYPLGLFETVYQEKEVAFTKDSKLVFYTDGISEAENAAGEQFGSERLLNFALVRGASSMDVVRDACRFAGDGHPQDDATVVMLSRMNP
jgi:phosphoserine phosphatase RsbU/P